MRDGWEVAKLGEVCLIQQGRRVDHKPIGEETFPVLGATGIIGTWKEASYDEPAVALGCRGTVGIPRLISEPSWFGNNVMALRPIDHDRLLLPFLACALEHCDLNSQGAIGGQVQKQITRKSLSPVMVPLPPLDEQRRIVDLIGAVDDATAAAEANHREGLVAGAQVVGEAMLAGDPDMGILDDVAKWYSGATPKAGKPEFYEGGTIPWAVIADVQDKPISGTAKSLTEAGAAVVGRKAPVGSVLVSMYGTIGRSAIVTTEMTTNQAIAWGVPKAGHTGEFIFAWIRLNRVKLDALGRGATQRNINRAMLREFPIPLVSEAREQELMELSDAVDAVVRASESTVTRLRGLRSNLLTALLSGEHVIPESYDELLEVSA